MQFIFRRREEFFHTYDNSTIPTHHFLHGLIDVCRNLWHNLKGSWQEEKSQQIMIKCYS